MKQEVLFYESPLDAIGADVAELGGFKKAGPMLWPSKTDAAGRLRSSLSEDHAQKLDIEELIEIMRLARDVKSNATLNYLAQTLGFKFEWIKPDDAHAELQRQFIDAVNRAEKFGHMLKGRM